MIYSPNLLLWLEAILFERFGVDFTLRLYEDRWALTAPGLDGCVEIMRAHTSFVTTAGATPCSQWNARASGFQTAIASVLPAPGATVLPEPLVIKDEGGCRVGYDILALAAWMMTRHEEICAEELDEYERYPAVQSHAYRHGYLERPIVDEWLFVLRQVIQKTWPQLTLRINVFATRVSHDVDEPSRVGFLSIPRLGRAMVGDILKRRDLSAFIRAPLINFGTGSTLCRFDPYNTFDWLMRVSERNGLRSAFYFICGRTDPSKDALYEPEHRAIRSLLREIHSRGHEIGLHPSFNTFRSPHVLAQEAQRLRRICAEEGIEQELWGGRMHWLRWEQPTTMRAWADAGMSYDSTLGYADLPGFRCGTCFEYPAFDVAADRMRSLRIRPLIAMDCTVMADRYLGLGVGEEAFEKFVGLKEACRAVGGAFTLLWHNTELLTPPKRTLYERILTA